MARQGNGEDRELDAPPLVAMRGIAKRFGDFVANDGIDLDIRAGEVHALLGENGAGKSTLVKILYGLLQPSAGEIAWEGRRVVLDNPVAARSLGIGMVFQHFSLFENLTVAENIAAAMAQDLSLAAIAARVTEIGARYGLALDPERPVWTLSAGERQRIEIVRCLMQEPRLIVLDEPTSVLTPQEAERLFETLERLRDQGTAILYISHRLEEVRRLCTRATILRLGRKVDTLDPRAVSARQLAAMMVGAEVGEVRADIGPAGAGVLEIAGLSLPPGGVHGVALKDVSLDVRAGEIVGIAGIAGNGQSELFAALSGERRADHAGTIRIGGVDVGLDGVNARRALGAAFVAEERLGHGAVPAHALSENIVLTRHAESELTWRGFVMPAAARGLADRVRKAFDVRAGRGDPAAATLSGGNLQKFVVGREMTRKPRLLVVNQPTWGVDAAAATLIRQALVDGAKEGAAIVVISQDLDELFEVSSRIAVIHDGRLSPPRPVAELTREVVGLVMGGGESGHAR